MGVGNKVGKAGIMFPAIFGMFLVSEEDRYLKAFQKWVDDYALITTKSGEGCPLYTHYAEDAYLEVQVFGDFGKSITFLSTFKKYLQSIKNLQEISLM